MSILQQIFTTALWSQLGALLWQIIQAFAGTAAVLVLVFASGCCFNLQMGWKNKPCEVPAVEEPELEAKPVSHPAIVDVG